MLTNSPFGPESTGLRRPPNVAAPVFLTRPSLFTFFKTDNRNLTGTMNRTASEAQWFDDDFDRLNDSINGFLHYASSREAFEKAAATINLSVY